MYFEILVCTIFEEQSTLTTAAQTIACTIGICRSCSSGIRNIPTESHKNSVFFSVCHIVKAVSISMHFKSPKTDGKDLRLHQLYSDTNIMLL